MNYPVTRQTLQNMRKENTAVKTIVDVICQGVERTAIETTEHRYVYTFATISESILLKIYDSLKEKFIDCDVVLGKNYIWVDWY